jgi:hypothetical protein
METEIKYERYPAWVMISSNLLSLAIYGLGLFIIHGLGWIPTVFYFIYILLLEYRIIRYHCVNCYYWGKSCGFGKGRISSLLFKKGDSTEFCKKDMTWKDMLPDLFVTLLPLVVGIYLLIVKFYILILCAIILMVILTTTGNGFIRGKLTCRYCKQRELGCPADKLFNKG